MSREWARDGLLALFFLTVGLELIQEIRVGSLHNPRAAAVPILAAMAMVATFGWLTRRPRMRWWDLWPRRSSTASGGITTRGPDRNLARECDS